MKIITLILRILLGSVFIFSGIVKLYPIEPFEFNFVEIGVSSWAFAPYFARGVIAFEVFLGLLLISGYNLKRITLPATFALLVLFTGYLFFQLYKEGNVDNCGCFGTFLEMTPIQSIVKNAVLLALTIYLFFAKPHILAYSKWWMAVIPALCSVSTVFILNMPDSYWVKNYKPDYKTGEIDYDHLPRTFSNGETVEMNKGKKLLLFFSVSCPHCKQAAQKISIMKKRNPNLPAYVFFWGAPQGLYPFIKETKLDLPYAFYNHLNFMKIVDGAVPAIMIVENGKVLVRWDKMTLDTERIEQEFLKEQ